MARRVITPNAQGSQSPTTGISETPVPKTYIRKNLREYLNKLNIPWGTAKLTSKHNGGFTKMEDFVAAFFSEQPHFLTKIPTTDVAKQKYLASQFTLARHNLSYDRRVIDSLKINLYVIQTVQNCILETREENNDQGCLDELLRLCNNRHDQILAWVPQAREYIQMVLEGVEQGRNRKLLEEVTESQLEETCATCTELLELCPDDEEEDRLIEDQGKFKENCKTIKIEFFNRALPIPLRGTKQPEKRGGKGTVHGIPEISEPTGKRPGRTGTRETRFAEPSQTSANTIKGIKGRKRGKGGRGKAVQATMAMGNPNVSGIPQEPPRQEEIDDDERGFYKTSYDKGTINFHDGRVYRIGEEEEEVTGIQLWDRGRLVTKLYKDGSYLLGEDRYVLHSGEKLHPLMKVAQGHYVEKLLKTNWLPHRITKSVLGSQKPQPTVNPEHSGSPVQKDQATNYENSNGATNEHPGSPAQSPTATPELTPSTPSDIIEGASPEGGRRMGLQRGEVEGAMEEAEQQNEKLVGQIQTACGLSPNVALQLLNSNRLSTQDGCNVLGECLSLLPDVVEYLQTQSGLSDYMKTRLKRTLSNCMEIISEERGPEFRPPDKKFLKRSCETTDPADLNFTKAELMQVLTTLDHVQIAGFFGGDPLGHFSEKDYPTCKSRRQIPELDPSGCCDTYCVLMYKIRSEKLFHTKDILPFFRQKKKKGDEPPEENTPTLFQFQISHAWKNLQWFEVWIVDPFWTAVVTHKYFMGRFDVAFKKTSNGSHNENLSKFLASSAWEENDHRVVLKHMFMKNMIEFTRDESLGAEHQIFPPHNDPDWMYTKAKSLQPPEFGQLQKIKWKEFKRTLQQLWNCWVESDFEFNDHWDGYGESAKSTYALAKYVFKMPLKEDYEKAVEFLKTNKWGGEITAAQMEAVNEELRKRQEEIMNLDESLGLER